MTDDAGGSRRRSEVRTLAIVTLCCGLLGSVGLSNADPQPLETVANVDLERYATGRWYEIARLPNRFQKRCVRNASAEYIRESQKRIAVINRCERADGKVMQAEGVARLPDVGDTTRLKVRFAPAFLSFIPAVWGDYWIIDLAEDYGYAVVGEPKRRYLWILSRSPSLDKATLDAIGEGLLAQGYDPEQLVFTEQSD